MSIEDNKSARVRNPRRPLARLLKGLVAGGLLWALYQQLFVLEDIGELYGGLRTGLATEPPWPLLSAATLAPLNILLEAVKYRLLLPPAQRGSVWKSVRVVCAGLTIGIVTPNRVGEYLGRLSEAEPGQRTHIIASTVLGGAAQWVPLLCVGALASSWLGTASLFAVHEGYLLVAALLALLVTATFLRLDLGLGVARSLLSRISLPPALRPIGRRVSGELARLAAFAKTHRADLGLALLLASVRYFVYLAQIALAFVYFGLDADWLVAGGGVAVLLLVQTFLPLPAVLQALARVELAALLWEPFEPNELGLVAAVLAIFVLNLGLPALVGLVFVLRADVAKALEI